MPALLPWKKAWCFFRDFGDQVGVFETKNLKTWCPRVEPERSRRPSGPVRSHPRGDLLPSGFISRNSLRYLSTSKFLFSNRRRDSLMSKKCFKSIRKVRSSHDKQTPIKSKFKLVESWGAWTPDLCVNPCKSEQFPFCSHYDVSIVKQSQGNEGQATRSCHGSWHGFRALGPGSSKPGTYGANRWGCEERLFLGAASRVPRACLGGHRKSEISQIQRTAEWKRAPGEFAGSKLLGFFTQNNLVPS